MFITIPKSGVCSLRSLKERVHGYLKLDIQECTYKRKLTPIIHDGKRYYIVGGVYISPLSKVILQNEDKIKGLLLDTTWKVMPVYVTSIIMGCSMNIGIPLGFAFGSGEDKLLYEQHFNAFAAQTGISLSKYVIESDQGSALKAVCQEKCAAHLACLRHLLVSLRFSAFSFAVSEIIKCASQYDFDNALKTFAIEFEKIKTEKEITELNKVLAKLGM